MQSFARISELLNYTYETILHLLCKTDFLSFVKIFELNNTCICSKRFCIDTVEESVSISYRTDLRLTLTCQC